MFTFISQHREADSGRTSAIDKYIPQNTACTEKKRENKPAADDGDRRL